MCLAQGPQRSDAGGALRSRVRLGLNSRPEDQRWNGLLPIAVQGI